MKDEASAWIAILSLLTAPSIFCLAGEGTPIPTPLIPVSQEDLRQIGLPFPPRTAFVDGYDLMPLRPTDLLAFRFRLPAEDVPAFLHTLSFPEFRISDFDAPCTKGSDRLL